MSIRITNSIPVFMDGLGNLLDGGQIYIGQVDQDPQAYPLQAYWDSACTIPADQPLRTLGGMIRNGAIPSSVYVSGDDYSMRVADSNDAQIDYIPSYKADAQSFQPLDSELTAIAALATTPFGRSLLTLASNSALVTQLGGLNYLPLSGGTVTSTITRQGAGAHLFFNDGALASGRIYVATVGDSNPASGAGDITFFIEP